MKTRSTHALVFTIVLASFAAAVGYGQAKLTDTRSTKPVATEIAIQPGCPLLLAVLSIEDAMPLSPKAESDATGPSVADRTRTTIRLKVDNIGDKPVRGYVIGFLGDHTKMVSTTPLGKFIERGRSNPMPASASGEWTKVLISVDYVEFSDGTSWGEDSFRRSETIERFRAGRDLAMGRLNDIVVTYPDHEFFLRQVNVFNGVSISDPFRTPSEEMLQMQFDFGYDTVLKGLRSPGKRRAEGDEIARKLELMQPARPPK